MSIVQTFDQFKAAWQSGNTITVGSDIVIDEDLASIKGVTINGAEGSTKKTITFSKELALNGNGIIFNNLKIVFNGDIGMTCDMINIAFKNCEIESSGDTFINIARISNLNVIPASVSFTNTDIICAGNIALIGGTEYTVGNYSHFAESALKISGGEVSCGGDEPFKIAGRCDRFKLVVAPDSLDVSAADHIIILNADGAEISIGSSALGEEFGTDKEKTPILIDVDKTYSAISSGKILFGTLANNQIYLVKSNAAAMNGNPGGYAVFSENKGVTFSVTSFDFDWVESIDDLNRALDMARYVSTYGSISALITLKATVSADTISVIDTYAGISGNTLTVRNLALENSKLYCATGGKIIVNMKLSMDQLSWINENGGTITVPHFKGEYPIRGPFNSNALVTNPILDGPNSGASEAITNKTLQMMINKFGKRIFMITFDNNYKVPIGYSSSEVKSADDFILESIGGVDMIGIRHYIKHPSIPNQHITYVTWKLTSYIQQICIMDEDTAWRPDIMQIT